MLSPPKTRVLAIASGGGHWVQLQRLCPAFDECDVVFVSVHATDPVEVEGRKFYAVADMSRFSLVNAFVLIPQLAAILLKERPTIVITTGAAPGLIGIALAKCLVRARTLWIDSIANCERMSLSGSLARFFADEWLTQWPRLAGPKGPKFWGAVL